PADGGESRFHGRRAGYRATCGMRRDSRRMRRLHRCRFRALAGLLPRQANARHPLHAKSGLYQSREPGQMITATENATIDPELLRSLLTDAAFFPVEPSSLEETGLSDTLVQS